MVVGCGGGVSRKEERTRVSTAVSDFAHAFGNGNGKKACAKLTPAARTTFVSRIQSIVGTRDCADAIGKLPAVAGANITGPFQTAKVDSVTVNGDTATARIIAAGHTAPVALQRRGGEWLLTRVPGT
jgi:hypothetical protein